MKQRKMGAKNRIVALLLMLCVAITSSMFWAVPTYAEDEIPTYSGKASLEINGNAPCFTDEEITTSSFESYGELDKLGRVTTAVACVGRDLMPSEERESIDEVRPTGWKQNKYPGIIHFQIIGGDFWIGSVRSLVGTTHNIKRRSRSELMASPFSYDCRRLSLLHGVVLLYHVWTEIFLNMILNY